MLRRRNRENSPEIAAYKHSPAKKLFAHPSQGMGVGADAWGSDSRVDCLEDTLRKLVQHGHASPRKSLGLPEKQETLTLRTSHYVFSDHRTPPS